MAGSFVDLGIAGIEETEAIGSGDRATVYRASQPALNRSVAVKVIQGIRDPATARRVAQEASALASLSEHPGIVTLYSSGVTAENQPYLVMQYCPRGSLQEQLDVSGPLSVADSCRAISQIAGSVGDAHDKDVLHRDLKPANILIDADGHYLVSDFGIDAQIAINAGLPASVSVTAGYVPPEILRGEPATAAGDVYSLGATLYALLRAQVPFASAAADAKNARALIKRLGTEVIEDTRLHGVPDAIATLIERCMSKDPAQRPPLRELAALAADAAAERPAFGGTGVLPGPPVAGAAPPLPSNVTAALIPVLAVPSSAAPAPPPAPPNPAPKPSKPAKPSNASASPKRPPRPKRPKRPQQPQRNQAGIVVAIGLLAVLVLGGFFVALTLLHDAYPNTAAASSTASDTNSDEMLETDADTSAAAATTGAERGSELVLLQAFVPSTANPYLASTSSDALASSLVLEPLARIAPDGTLAPALATEIPVPFNGISADNSQVTWSLRRDVNWSDGTPFTADDVVFSWEYCVNAPPGCTVEGAEDVVDVVALDAFTVIVTLARPGAYPYAPFVGFRAPIIQRAQFQDCVGALAGRCTQQDESPIGTGPYVFGERLDGEVTYDVNPNYRGLSVGEPFFTSVVMKGVSDSEEAARLVLELGQADHAWNLMLDSILRGQLAQSEIGRFESAVAGDVEHINLNQTNNRAAGQLQSSYDAGANPNPFFFENPDLAEALSLAINRDALIAYGYEYPAVPTCNMWNVRRNFSPDDERCLIQDTDQANVLLDDLGYIDTNRDGVRELPQGAPLEFDFSTSNDPVRVAVQRLIVNDWAEIGVIANMRNTDPARFFDPNDKQSIWRFQNDMVMFATGPTLPDPLTYLSMWGSQGIPTIENRWTGLNIPRMANDDYDSLLVELANMAVNDPGRAEIVARLDSILTMESGAVIPLVLRGTVSAIGNDIMNAGPLNGWDSEYWNIQEWTRED